MSKDKFETPARSETKAPAPKKPATPEIPLDTATTDRSPGRQGQFGEKPKTTVCPYCGK